MRGLRMISQRFGTAMNRRAQTVQRRFMSGDDHAAHAKSVEFVSVGSVALPFFAAALWEDVVVLMATSCAFPNATLLVWSSAPRPCVRRPTHPDSDSAHLI